MKILLWELVAIFAFHNFQNCSCTRMSFPVGTVLTRKTGENRFTESLAGFQSSLKRFQNGILGVVPSFVEASRVHKKKKKNGEQSITFSEYLKLEQGWDNFFKLTRMIITYPLSPEFFFYVNVVSPIISSSSVWAWKAFPSSFQTNENNNEIQTILKQRRLLGVFSSLNKLKLDIIEELNPEEKEKKKNCFKQIESALKKRNIDASLQDLQDLYISSKKEPPSKQGLELTSIPGSIVKTICDSFAIDGVPNIPLIRNLNKGELAKQIDKVRKSDEFLQLIDTKQMTYAELKEACFERCISTTSKAEAVLRSELNNWLTRIKQPITTIQINTNPKNGPIRTVNVQNYRLVMMCLNSAQGCKTDPYIQVFRDLLR